MALAYGVIAEALARALRPLPPPQQALHPQAQQAGHVAGFAVEVQLRSGGSGASTTVRIACAAAAGSPSVWPAVLAFILSRKASYSGIGSARVAEEPRQSVE